MASIRINDFSAGWIPSDDSFSGRKNGLLQMDNMELDQNGALSITGGATLFGSGYLGDGIDIFSNIEANVRHDYVATAGGAVARDGINIIVGGATDRVAFGVAYDYTLICSGTQRKKVDHLGNVVNLGLTTPAVAPTYIQTYFRTLPIGGGFGINAGKGTVINNAGSAELTPTTAHTVAGEWIAFGQTDDTFVTHDLLNELEVTGNVKTIVGSSDDLILITLSSATVGSIAKILNVTFNFNTDLGQAATALPVDNYYSLFFEAADIADGSYSVTGTTEQVQMWWRRGNFTRLGGSSNDWSTIKGLSIELISSDNAIVIDFAVQGGILSGNIFPTYQFIGGTQNNNATYLQVNVNTNVGTYLGKSPTGPQVTILQNDRPYSAIITPYITGLESQVDQIWLFRSNSNLNGFYRIAVLTVANWATPFIDNVTDETALDIDITADPSLVSVQTIDKIVNVLGPFEGRWFYFTITTMYPSEINDPDLINVSLGVKTTGVQSETSLFAKIINDNGILVGTSRAIYLLTGTFTTLADGTIDLFYRPIEIKYPPISYDADVYNGVVYFMSKDGWRGVDASGNSVLLVAPNSDRIYRGDTCYGYSIPNLLNIIPGTVRFPIVVARNKLWCVITGEGRIEVYDFIRKYWHPTNYIQGGAVQGITYAQDGNIIALLSYGLVRFLHVIDDRSNIYIHSQVLTPVFDNGTPRQRKDAYTFRSKMAGSGIGISFITDVGTFNAPAFTNLTVIDVVIDLNSLFGGNHPKWFQVLINNATIISEIEIFFEERPIPLTFKRGYNNNFKSSSPKRLRTWPFTLDTFGQDVTFNLLVDNVVVDSATFNTQEKTTVQYSTKLDLFGTDYGYTFNWVGGVPFELWEEMDPYIVQTLPQSVLFMQFGPQDLFRYGSVKEFSFRVLPVGSLINYTIYFADQSVLSDSFIVKANKEDSYSIPCTKGTAGEIVRVEFSSSDLFYPLSLRCKVFVRGVETDGQWLPL